MENLDDIYFATKYSWGLKIPVFIPKMVVPCLNCGEEFADYPAWALFCCQGCHDAFQFRLDVGLPELEKENR